MTAPLLNQRDLAFVLYELLDADELTKRPRFAEHSRETFDAALKTAHDIARDHFLPHNREADEREPWLEDGRVATVPAVKAALDAFSKAGLMAAHADAELGGMQLPWVVAQACMAYFQGANVGTAAYPLLTIAAANLVNAFGTQEQKALYLAPMLEGRFFGTMALTEPSAGSSLGDLRTTAEPTPEGHYHIRGAKIFISGGEHELAENIVHLVLARIRGAPAGIKGISLFLVPRRLLDADGRAGAKNDVALGGLIHKMGFRGTVSAILNFGERDSCVGYLVGAAGQGLACMFRMMNEARIGVGMGAVMLGYRGYLESLEYARGRPQGWRAGEKDPTRPPVAIIEHADVKRMLLAQKAYVEGSFALGLYLARLVDEKMTAPEEARRREAGLLLELLTPIMKAWPSDWCLEANRLAIQVLGGYGYTREFPVEQLYRDNRLNAIHEGTNGIQALDLLGRKVVMENGAAAKLLMAEIERACEAAKAFSALADHARALRAAAKAAKATTRALVAGRFTRGVEAFLANASVYLDMLGHTVIAWMWLKQATVAARRLDGAAGAERDFYEGKLAA
ncbi:MAG: acyl-CoA dehydrogenase, partial [Alphaproteobacteria bacterium]